MVCVIDFVEASILEQEGIGTSTTGPKSDQSGKPDSFGNDDDVAW